MVRVVRAAVAASGPPVLCLELLVGKRSGEPCVSLLASIPGRESTMAYHWGSHGRLMTSSELSDLAVVVMELISQSYITKIGAQDPLPMA